MKPSLSALHKPTEFSGKASPSADLVHHSQILLQGLLQGFGGTQTTTKQQDQCEERKGAHGVAYINQETVFYELLNGQDSNK